MRFCTLPACCIALAATAYAQAASDKYLSDQTAGVEVRRIDLDFPNSRDRRTSRVFGSDVLDAIIRPYLRRLRSEDLAALTQELTRLYVTSGYVTSGAYIADQPVVDGAIMVTVIEGRPAELRLMNSTSLGQRWYRTRLGRTPNGALNRTDLESKLKRLSSDPRIRNFHATLKPSPDRGRGESDLELTVTERAPIAFSSVFSNYQSPSVGAQRITGMVNLYRVAGIGDELQLVYGYSSGVSPLLSVAYTAPLNTRATTLTLSYRKNDFVVVEEIFRPLDVTSKSEIFSAAVRHPLFTTSRGDVTREFAVNVDAEYLRNSSKLLGQPFSLAPGAVNGKYSIAALRFGQEWVRWSRAQVLAARSRISVGLNAFGSTINRTAADGEAGRLPDSRFVSWLGQVQISRRVVGLQGRGTELLAKADVQLATDVLLPLEQFPLGGRFSVRGHRENELVRDQAAVVSAEWRVPVFRGGFLSRLQLAPFFDYGYGRNRNDAEGRAIAGAGMGARWAGEFRRGYGLRPTVELYWGPIRYNRAPLLRGNLQDRGLHFQIGFSGS